MTGDESEHRTEQCGHDRTQGRNRTAGVDLRMHRLNHHNATGHQQQNDTDRSGDHQDHHLDDGSLGPLPHQGLPNQVALSTLVMRYAARPVYVALAPSASVMEPFTCVSLPDPASVLLYETILSVRILSSTASAIFSVSVSSISSMSGSTPGRHCP